MTEKYSFPPRSGRSFRRYFQFRLVTLLFLPLLASIPLAPLAWRVRSKAAERAAVLVITQSGGSAYYASETSENPAAYAVPKIVAFFFGEDFCNPVTSVALAPVPFRKVVMLDSLVDMPNLETVYLAHTAIKDEDLLAFSRVRCLRRLVLQQTAVTDSGLGSLTSCARLEEIDAKRTLVTGDGLACLGRLPELRTIYLDFCPVDDNSVVGLSNLTQLRYLSLYGTQISDEALAAIGRLDRLEVLNIGSTKISGHGLVQLAGCKSLTTLDLHNAPLDDDCVGYFRGLAQIIDLNLSGTQISASGAEEIRSAIPQCHVRIDVGRAPKRNRSN